MRVRNFLFNIVLFVLYAHEAYTHASLKYPEPRHALASGSKSDVDKADSSPVMNANTHYPEGPEYKRPYPCGASNQKTKVNQVPVGKNLETTYTVLNDHKGGHCQWSVSYDDTKSFIVFHEQLDNCLLSSRGNSASISVPVSEKLINGKAVIAWSWVPVEEDQFYNNCFDAEITGSSSTSFTGKPMIVVDYGSQSDHLYIKAKQNHEYLWRGAPDVTVSNEGGSFKVTPAEFEDTHALLKNDPVLKLFDTSAKGSGSNSASGGDDSNKSGGSGGNWADNSGGGSKGAGGNWASGSGGHGHSGHNHSGGSSSSGKGEGSKGAGGNWASGSGGHDHSGHNHSGGSSDSGNEEGSNGSPAFGGKFGSTTTLKNGSSAPRGSGSNIETSPAPIVKNLSPSKTFGNGLPPVAIQTNGIQGTPQKNSGGFVISKDVKPPGTSSGSSSIITSGPSSGNKIYSSPPPSTVLNGSSGGPGFSSRPPTVNSNSAPIGSNSAPRPLPGTPVGPSSVNSSPPRRRG